MKFVGVIPARYESTRFPGKPLVDILGHPMIWWVYQQCLKVNGLDEVVVATDSKKIQSTCKLYNMNVCMTSTTCLTGSDRVAEAAKNLSGDVFVNIQGDEPVINPNMIQQVIDVFQDPNVYFGTLKSCITDDDEIASSNTVKVVTDHNNNALYFSRSPIPSNLKGCSVNVYRHVGIYAYTKDFLMKFHEMEQTELELGEGIEPLRAMENGYKIKVAETTYTSIGVDRPEDVEKVIHFIKNVGEIQYE